MKVYVAEEAGFCFGVKRALEIIEQLHEQGHHVYTYGQLIHNRTVLDDLESKGIYAIDSPDQLNPKQTLVIRTHGISREIETDLKTQNIAYVDATCPLVKRLQNVIRKLAAVDQRIVLVGDKQHPEIIAAVSYAGQSQPNTVILGSEAEALALEPSERMAVTAQTTLDSEFFDRIVSILKTKTKDLHVYNTICKATRDRQDAIRKLAPTVDVVLIVGGKNSSNTAKLYKIASAQNRHTFHIESSRELEDPDFARRFQRFLSVGITAGASTPPDEIEKIKKYFNKLNIEKEMNHG
ncbi:MAG: 4-hydroxy-3-methylbut-2-enyl diphosphate reductase [Candidatus Omnitrophota bacterium]